MKKYLVIVLIGCYFLGEAQAPLKVSLLMPFCSKQIAENPNCANAELGNLCRSYYQGMLIALDSLRQTDVAIKLTLFDTQNDSLTTLKQIQKSSFKESQLVIGPVLQGGNKMLTKFSADNKVYHISPLMTFSKTKLIDPYWVSSNPDLPSFANIILDYIMQHNDSANIMVVGDQSSLDKSITPAFKKLVGTSKKHKIKLISYTPTLDLNTYFSNTSPNIVIIPTAKEQVANSILFQIKDTSNLTCIGFQQWFDFKNADIQLWEHKHVQFASTYFVNYQSEATKQFILKYRERFFVEPDEAAIKGYDQALFYIGLRLAEGSDFMEKAIDKSYQVLHTTYQFRRNKEGGAYQNNYLNFIEFRNDKLEPIGIVD